MCMDDSEQQCVTYTSLNNNTINDNSFNSKKTFTSTTGKWWQSLIGANRNSKVTRGDYNSLKKANGEG